MCAKKAARARVAPGRAGPACQRQREEGRGGLADWAGWPGLGRGEVLGRREEKKKKERGRWAGPKMIGKEREVFFSTKRFKQFNSNLNSREFKFRLDNKH